jgi:hypothetical protein
MLAALLVACETPTERTAKQELDVFLVCNEEHVGMTKVDRYYNGFATYPILERCVSLVGGEAAGSKPYGYAWIVAVPR